MTLSTGTVVAYITLMTLSAITIVAGDFVLLL